MMAPTAWRATNTSTPSPRFLAVDLQRQLLTGSFEHALNHLIDHELDLSSFDARFNNDATGAAGVWRFSTGVRDSLLRLQKVLFA